MRKFSLPTFAWVVLAFLALPALVVIPLSFSSVRFFVFPPPGWSLRWYANFLTAPDWQLAIFISVGLGLASTLIALVLGTLASLALVRYRFRGRNLVYALLLSPLIMPVIILAIGLYFTFAPLGYVGSPVVIVVGHVILAAPYVIVTLMAALERFDITLERAALSLGCPPWQVFLRVTFPVIRPAFLAAAFLAFLASFDDLLIALFLGGPQMKTIQLQMWQGIRFESDPTIAAASSILMVVSLIVFVAVQAQTRRSLRETPRS
jgi:putative spermidine/putrescine transport system permease protein